jgi:hypothetical protein
MLNSPYLEGRNIGHTSSFWQTVVRRTTDACKLRLLKPAG